MPDTTSQTNTLTHATVDSATRYFFSQRPQSSIRDVSFLLEGGDAYTIIYDHSFQPHCYSIEEIADCFDGGYMGLSQSIWEESHALWMADQQEAGA
jgi:hypothetical protein